MNNAASVARLQAASRTGTTGASTICGPAERPPGDGVGFVERLTAAAFGSWLDYTVNGLIVGNIYALLAVGLALIFGVAAPDQFRARLGLSRSAPMSAGRAVTLLHTPLPRHDR